MALLVDRSELFSLTVGKNLEYGLRQEGLLSFVRELNGNEEEIYENYLRDASMYARGKNGAAFLDCFRKIDLPPLTLYTNRYPRSSIATSINF